MRIGVVGVPYTTGGGVLTRALLKYLRASAHEVLSFNYYYAGPHTRLQRWMRGALGWRLGLRYRDSLIRSEFHSLVKRVRAAHCDAVIAVEQGEILLQDLGNAKRIFYANAPTGHEVYFQMAKRLGRFDWQAYHSACRKEVEYYKASDVVIFCWNTHAEYVRQWVYQGNNIALHPDLGWYGCEPQARRAQYSYPPFLVYMGAMTAYWNNAESLSRLAHGVQYALHFYSPDTPEADLGLNHQGFADSTDVLCRYQLGVHSATRDLVRRYGFASKVMTYLSYGLPTFSPEWQLMSHQLGGVIAYNEQNFESLLEAATERSRWQELADMAHEQARQLEWGRVLKHLLLLLE